MKFPPTAPALPALALALLATACSPPATWHSTHAEPPAPHLREGAPRPGTDPAPPDPTTGEAVSLQGLLTFADAHSPILAVARSSRSRAEAARVAASLLAPSDPQLTVSVGPRLAPRGTGVEVEVSLYQSIFLAGERRLAITAADAVAELTDAEIEQLRWAVHCDVHAAYHRAIVERERALLAARVVAFQREVLRAVERRTAAGETGALPLRLTLAEVAQAEQALLQSEQAHRAARIRLAQLAGWPVAHPPDPEGKLDSPAEPPPVERLLAIARERLPLLRTRDAAVREAEARVALAEREAWPKPALGVQVRREGNPGPEGEAYIVLGSAQLTIPTFQRNQAERAKAGADAHVARTERDAARTLLEADVAEAHSRVTAAARRVKSYGTEVTPRLEENLTLLRRAFELGEIDLLELSMGRERFLRIQGDALTAWLDHFLALADLERVVGAEIPWDNHLPAGPAERGSR